MAKAVMHMQVTKKLFELMLEVKEKHLATVIEQYHCSRQELHDILWEEFNIPGMETRIANTALDFLIVSCEKKEDLESTLRKEIQRNILVAGIYYTNIAPDDITTTASAEFKKSCSKHRIDTKVF